jgi:crossover junction endodeoxyribonuclease RuvC
VKVLGIDPGVATTGWGVVELRGDRLVALDHGVILTPAKTSLADRLCRIARELRALVARVQPDAAAIEELFFAKESRSAAIVGHGRGVLLLALAELGLPIHEYNPKRVKVALNGHGGAEKFQMQNMIQRLLGLPEIPKPTIPITLGTISLIFLLLLPATSKAKATFSAKVFFGKSLKS